MNLDNVLPIPLEYTDYFKTAMDIALSSDVSRKRLLKQSQYVCTVYSGLGVKRNAGIMGTAEKHREVCKGFREIAIPGFFGWAKDNNHDFPKWCPFSRPSATQGKRGCYPSPT